MLASLLWVIVAALVVLWLLGFGFHIGGGLIFLLLMLAVIVAIVNLVSGSMWGGTRHVHTVAPTTTERVVERREVVEDPDVAP